MKICLPRNFPGSSSSEMQPAFWDFIILSINSSICATLATFVELFACWLAFFMHNLQFFLCSPSLAAVHSGLLLLLLLLLACLLVWKSERVKLFIYFDSMNE